MFRIIRILPFFITLFFFLNSARAEVAFPHIYDAARLEELARHYCGPKGTPFDQACSPEIAVCKDAFNSMYDGVIYRCLETRGEQCRRLGDNFYAFSHVGVRKLNDALTEFLFLNPAVKEAMRCPHKKKEQAALADLRGKVMKHDGIGDILSAQTEITAQRVEKREFPFAEETITVFVGDDKIDDTEVWLGPDKIHDTEIFVGTEKDNVAVPDSSKLEQPKSIEIPAEKSPEEPTIPAELPEDQKDTDRVAGGSVEKVFGPGELSPESPDQEMAAQPSPYLFSGTGGCSLASPPEQGYPLLKLSILLAFLLPVALIFGTKISNGR